MVLGSRLAAEPIPHPEGASRAEKNNAPLDSTGARKNGPEEDLRGELKRGLFFPEASVMILPLGAIPGHPSAP